MQLLQLLSHGSTRSTLSGPCVHCRHPGLQSLMSQLHLLIEVRRGCSFVELLVCFCEQRVGFLQQGLILGQNGVAFFNLFFQLRRRCGFQSEQGMHLHDLGMLLLQNSLGSLKLNRVLGQVLDCRLDLHINFTLEKIKAWKLIPKEYNTKTSLECNHLQLASNLPPPLYHKKKIGRNSMFFLELSDLLG